MTAYVGIDGKARKVGAAYIGVDGVARKVKKAYVGVNGVAQLWWVLEEGGGPVVLEVEKITSDTYVGETTSTGETFILIDIYPKANGTVKVTYGGLTKIVTDTSGAEQPNATQVFFGKYGGSSDSVETPTSGTLTISGDYAGFGCGAFKTSKTGLNTYWYKIKSIISLGVIELVPMAFLGATSAGGASDVTALVFPASLKRIEKNAISQSNVTSVSFEDPSGWYSVGKPVGGTSEETNPEIWGDPESNATRLKSLDSANYIWYKA